LTPRSTSRPSASAQDPARLAGYIGDMLAELAALAAQGGLSDLAATLRYAAVEAARAEPDGSGPRDQPAA